MARGFEFVEHTADYAVRVWGADFPGLVENAAQGLIELLANVGGVEAERHMELAVQGDCREEVLVRALKELLLLEEDGWLPVTAEVAAADHGQARLRVGVVYLASALDRVEAAVKAVTYHGLEIADQDDGLTVQIVFDT